MIVLAVGQDIEFAEAVDATVDRRPVTALGVMPLSLIRIPDLKRLSCREVATLASGDAPKGGPGLRPVPDHLSNLAES